MGDSRIGKCCCNQECDWPIITSTSAHTLSHIPANGTNRDNFYLQDYGVIVELSSPAGTIPDYAMTFNSSSDWTADFQQTTANHWHALTIRTALEDIAIGDRAGWFGVVNQSDFQKFQIYRHQYLLAELTCNSLHSLWADFQETATYQADPTLYDVGIPQDSRLFWGNSVQTLADGKLVLIFYDSTRNGTAWRRNYLQDTFDPAYEVTISEGDSYSEYANADTSWVIWRCPAELYFKLIKAIQ